ncbi:para-aminobenzoate synthetase component 2 [Mesocricetibacter intestinalis]|uniref:Para-aminobenzoate synthetase component 2 n=1 Tax=Mesocricetibacter intestinalis TaxID=1521930 RepID=A0A4R6V706_9PAST|nr:anthranilate synthase component II [Mesocricetibacter intestinalis]TDQ56510.1 para-aminobenzoate synthetase component 2 [Mesocricetibacter intestinalis]
MQNRLLIINNHDSFTYNLVDLLRPLSVRMQIIATEQLSSVTDMESFSHVLISPGPDVPEAYPQLFEMLRRHYRHKSILGVCLGHQTLCRFFGASLYNLSACRHGVEESFNLERQSDLFRNLPARFRIGLYHSWAVSPQNFPSELEIVGRCDAGVIMAVQHKTLPLYGVQFHPESFISEYGTQILSNWLEIGGSAL